MHLYERSTCIRRAAGAVVLICCIAFAGSSRVAAQAPPRGPAVRVNDALRIDVWRNTELSGTYTVRADSGLAHPLYASLKVVGLAQEQLEDRVHEFLSRFGENPQFLVTHLIPVSITGEVMKPELYMTPAGSTFLQILALAGGPTERANLKRIEIWRGTTRMTVDMSRGMTEANNIHLASGDQILVPVRSNVLRDIIAPIASVMGAVGVLVNILTN